MQPGYNFRISEKDGMRRVSQIEGNPLSLQVWRKQNAYGKGNYPSINADVLFFGKQADIVEENFSEGDLIFLSGNFVIEKDGQYTNYKIQNASFEFVGYPDEFAEDESANPPEDGYDDPYDTGGQSDEGMPTW